MGNRLLSLCLACVLTLTCAGCGMEWSDSDDATAVILPSSAETTTVALGTAGGPASHNLFGLGWVPAEASQPYTNTYRLNDDVFKLVYEGLFSLSEKLEAVNTLCRQTVTTDNTTFTFTLRTDVNFHDGEGLTPADVVYSLEEARRPGSFFADRLADVASIRAVGDDGVEVTLRAANSRFPALLDIPIVRRGTASDPAPPGTGPYVLHWEEGGGYLTRHSQWWQRRNLGIARIELQPVQTPDVLPYHFENKLVSLVNADMTDTDLAVVHSGYEFWDYPTTVFQFLGFSGDRNSPLSEPLLRQAVSAAADRATITGEIFSFWADPATLPVPPQHWSLESVLPGQAGYDLRVASEKLAEAGFADNDSDGILDRDGHPLAVVFLVNTENEFKRQAAESIAAALTSLGFEVTLNQLRYEDYLAALETGDYDLYYGETRLSCDLSLEPLFTGALRFAGGVSPELDALYRTMMASDNPAARSAFYTAFAAELPFAPLLFKRYAVLTQRGQLSEVAPVWQNIFLHMDTWEMNR